MTKSIGLGTAAIGRPQYINLRTETPALFDLIAFREKGMHLLEEAYQKGIRYFDTAPGYGMAEELLIDWLKEKNDETIEVATKWGYTYVANFNKNATQHEVKEHSLSKLNQQWEVSKQLLPFLSTYQIHSATLETGVLENKSVLDRLAALKEEYNILIGLSTTGANQATVLEKAMSIKRNGSFLFGAFQVTYNLLDQSLAELAKQINKEGRRIIVKEALANGRILPNNTFPNHQKVHDLLQVLSKKYEVGADAIALRFCIDRINPFKVLSGASNSDHLTANVITENFKLSEEDLSALGQLKVSPELYWQERKELSWS